MRGAESILLLPRPRFSNRSCPLDVWVSPPRLPRSIDCEGAEGASPIRRQVLLSLPREEDPRSTDGLGEESPNLRQLPASPLPRPLRSEFPRSALPRSTHLVRVRRQQVFHLRRLGTGPAGVRAVGHAPAFCKRHG